MNVNIRLLHYQIVKILSKSMDCSSAEKLADNFQFLDEVAKYIETTRSFMIYENYSEPDVCLAIGKTFLKKYGIDY